MELPAKENEDNKAVSPSYLNLLPLDLVNALVPYFSTPGFSRLVNLPCGQFRAQDNRNDIFIEPARNIRTYYEIVCHFFNIDLSRRAKNQHDYAKGQISYLKEHPFKRSFFLHNPLNSQVVVNVPAARKILRKTIQEKIDSAAFQKLTATEKNKLVVDFMRMYPSKKIMEHFLQSGISANIQDTDSGFSLLRLAVEEKKRSLVKLLLKKNAHPDQPDKQLFTPLMRSVVLNDERTCKLLSDTGTGLNIINLYGYSALAYAARKGRERLVDTLLAAGAQVLPYDDETVKNVLCEAIKSGSVPILKKLLDRAQPLIANPFSLEYFFNRGLHYAARKGKLDMIRTFFQVAQRRP